MNQEEEQKTPGQIAFDQHLAVIEKLRAESQKRALADAIIAQGGVVFLGADKRVQHQTLESVYGVPMDRHYQRKDLDNGELTIVFTDAGHLADSFNHADKLGLGPKFEHELMRLIRMALGRTLPKMDDPDGLWEARPGIKSTITISADSRTSPSFFWSETPKGMHGGLIFHSYSGSWGIHT